MKRLILFLLPLALSMLQACVSGRGCPEGGRRAYLLSTWQFTLLDSANNPITPPQGGVGGGLVTIPHDWAISGPFDRANDLQEVIVVQNGEKEPTWKTGRSGGLPWIGRAVYRTTLCNRDYQLDSLHWSTLVIDGAMSHADVFINGEEVCYWPYGYNTFDCNLTPFLQGDSTTIEIFLENKPQQSRWYPGAGLYRHVHLISTARTHIAPDGVWITTPEVNADQATVHIETTVLDGIDTLRSDYSIETVITYNDTKVASQSFSPHPGGVGGGLEVTIPHPHLWSPEAPNLYYAITTLRDAEGRELDRTRTRFGIRSISYTPEHGFQLNGQTRKFKGVCLHHDLGPLGAAVHKDALRHQLTMLKEMGCDAIRTSHNMPAPELVQLCDEMGLMMMLEPFDVWNWGKTDNDYHVEFDTYHEWDIEYMVRHYRSCPSVMLWSSGNEVWNQVLPDGIELVTHLQEIFHRLDPTRPVTNGIDQAKDVIHNGFGDAVELPGFNYRTSRYEEGYEHMHHKMLLGSETASTVSSRGVYKLPVVIRPDAIYPDNQCSGYDVEYCAWSGLPEQDFQLQDDYPWTLGQFVWTGFDYLGEPSPYDTDAWPSHSSYFGIIDLASLPKDRYYLYRSQWNTTSPTLHVLPHWNWNAGDTVPVFCYTTYPVVELFVNGKSYGCLRAGESQMPKVGEFDIPVWGSAPRPELLPRYRRMWFDVPYEPGEVKVVAYNEDGSVADTRIVRTAGEPYAIRAEWANRDENPDELCYVTVSVVDKDGILCPMANNRIHCDSRGFVATANGDAACLESFVEPDMSVFAGQATFIVRRGNTATFSAPNLKSATIKLK